MKFVPWTPRMKGAPAVDAPVGEIEVMAGRGAWPLPASPTVWVPPTALLRMVKVPVRVPDAMGWNTTETVHEPPMATGEPQVFICVNSAVVVTLETVSG